MTSKRLWSVRTSLRKKFGERKIRVLRYAVLANSNEDAISLMTAAGIALCGPDIESVNVSEMQGNPVLFLGMEKEL